MAESYELGKIGEDIAVKHLQKLGYEILEQRWKHHHMEIDIFAIDLEEHVLVSAEVKTRRSAEWGSPEEAVDYRKMMRVVRATDAYMKQHRINMPVRFDIFSILIHKGESPKVNHIKDAFYPPLG